MTNVWQTLLAFIDGGGAFLLLLALVILNFYNTRQQRRFEQRMEESMRSFHQAVITRLLDSALNGGKFE